MDKGWWCFGLWGYNMVFIYNDLFSPTLLLKDILPPKLGWSLLADWYSRVCGKLRSSGRPLATRGRRALLTTGSFAGTFERIGKCFLYQIGTKGNYQNKCGEFCGFHWEATLASAGGGYSIPSLLSSLWAGLRQCSPASSLPSPALISSQSTLSMPVP